MRIVILFVAVLAGIYTGGAVFVQTGNAQAEVEKISAEALKVELDTPELRIIDVRRTDHYASSDTKIKGAVRQDPDAVSTWMNQYSKSDRIVLYCA